MKSMTGFGTCQLKNQQTIVDVSARSVNGRFFDVKIHLPSEYHPLEKTIREIAASHIKRGSVSIIISRKRSDGGDIKDVIIDEALAKKYVMSLKSLAKKLKISGEPNLEMLIRAGDVISTREPKSIVKGEDKIVLLAVKNAVATLEKERIREGKALKIGIENHLKQLEKLCAQIFNDRVEANSYLKEKLTKRVNDLKLASFDDKRISDEISWLLDKSDIDEELTRLKEHLSHFSTLIHSRESQGKKLDFYTQELLREVNTIGSKANHGKITQSVIEAKNVIEQIKEQVQNIE